MSITSVVNDTVTSESVINALKPLPPTISGYSVGGLDDTALDPAGGQTVQINGTGFLAGATITFDGSAVAVVTYVNPNRLTFTSPAKSAGTYTIYVVNPDGGTAIFIPGIIYSVLPTWTTSAGTLGSYYETTSISNTVVASGDAPITYSLFSGSLPTGSTLYANGVITGTAPVDSSSTTYSFTIEAIDAQLQGSTRSFSLTINVDAVTWVSPANNTTYTSAVDSAIANVALSATDAAGYAVSYSANALPTGLSLTGSNIAGTPTVIADSSTLLTATAATTNRTATRTINWSITVANDVYFEYNTLLIPGASTTFVDDASTNNFAVTINGDTKPNNTNPYTPGYYSNLFDGTVDRLVPSANAAFAFGTGAFCIEAWMYNTTLKNYSCLVTTRPDNSNYADAYHIGFDSVGGLSLYVNDTSRAGCPAGTVILNIWQHLVCCRNASGLVSIYINGVRKGTETVTTNFTRNLLGIADFPTTPAEGLIGYISNLRLVKGSSVYDPTQTSITVPTTPLTAIANTSILTCQSNRFIDNSTNNFTLTVFGDTKIQSFQPFTPNTSYSTYGSGYFDGTGDYLTSPANTAFAFAKGDLTVQMWIYPTATITTPANIGLFYIEEVNGLVVGLSNGYIAMGRRTIAYDLTSTYIPIVNTWTHIAVTRSGATAWIFANGVQVGTVTAAGGDPNNNSNYVCTTGLPTIAGNYAGGAGFGYFPGYISDIQVVKGTAVYTTTFTPPAAPLTAIANTSLLTLQNNQSVNNNVFLDNSTNNFLVTRNGNTTQGTFSPYGGNWSNFYGTTTMGWQTPAASATTIIGTATLTSASTFTVEAWVYQLTRHSGGGAALGYVFGSMNISGGQADWTIGPNSDGKLTVFWYNSGNNICNSTNTIPLNTWTHIAVSISAGAISMYINGVKETLTGTTTATTTSGSPLGYLASGGYAYGGSTWQGFNGYISNLRVVKSALYSETFTPSTTPLTAISGTSLLTCQSNRFIDTSINSFTLTITNALTIQRFSPFSPVITTPTSYSGSFNGSSDYLTWSGNTVGTGAMTFECWFFYTASFGGIATFIGPGSGISGGLNCNLNDSTTFSFDRYGVSATNYTVPTISANTWNHVAFVRNSSNLATVFLNGVRSSTGAVSDTYSYTTSAAIGYTGGIVPRHFTGYISDARLVVGSNVYDPTQTTITVPTAPLTAIANTSILTCQSPTLIDNSTNRFTITAAGSPKPTTVNPFGFTSTTTEGYAANTIGGSGYFDGTGDYLTVPSTTAFAMGTGAYTIEAWVYVTSRSTEASIWATGANNNNFLITTGGLLRLYNGTSYTGTTVIPLNTWAHVAVVRTSTASNGTRLFVNGVSDLVFTDTTNQTSATTGVIGVNGTGGEQYFFGYISNLRVIKGQALYTSNFVPPSAPLTAIQNTVLLNNMTGAGIYDAAMMTNMETVADAKLSTAISKFGGSSVSFDGTGDYLSNYNPSYSLSVGSGDFTYECWLYVNALPGLVTSVYHLKNDTGLATTVFVLELTTNGAISISTGTAIIASGTAGKITTGSWIHFACVRTSGVFKTFFNGIQDISVANTTAYNGTYLYIGAWRYSSYDNSLNGYIDDIRITKGYARYTSNFTPQAVALEQF